MKVLEIGYTNPFLPGAGGVEDYIRKITEHLNNKGDSVKILCASRSRKFNHSQNILIEIYVPNFIWKLGLAKFYYNAKIYFYIKKYANDFDIVHINGDNGVFIPFIKNVKTIMTLHGSMILEAKSFRFEKNLKLIIQYYFLAVLDGLFENIACKRANILISETKFMKEYFENVTKRTDIKIIPTCFNINKDSKLNKGLKNIKELKNSGKFLALWVGLNPVRKNLGMSKKSVNELDDTILLTVGYSDPVPAKNVINLGYVDRATLEYLYDVCDVFIFPTRYEGFGLVILEAMSHGLVPITSSVDAMKELIEDGVDGFMVNTLAELINRIQYLRTHKEILYLMKENARKKASKYDCEIILNKIYTEFNSLGLS